MRHLSGTILGAALSAGVVAAAQAAPVAVPVAVLSVPYSIGTLTQTLQFLGDGSVRVCDGSVLVACDGSVVPAPNALAAVAGDGSVRLTRAITLLGDGSVRAGDGSVRLGDGSVAPAPNTDNLGSILLSSLSFSPNPFISASVSVVDNGAPTNFLITFGGSLALGGTAFTYELTGSATLTDATGDGVSLTAQPLLGLPTAGIIAGGIDAGGVAVIGSTLTGGGTTTLPPASGAGTCASCTLQILAIGIQGSGNGDQYAVTGTFDITAPTAVPAPAPLGLLAVGLLGLFAARRRR